MSTRLAALADEVPHGARVADIGTDHARLLVRVVRDRGATTAIGVDLREDPLREAQRTLDATPPEITARIALRRGNGLAPLAPHEVDTIVVAGMGASSIVAILDADARGLVPSVRLVLQPANDWAVLRRWLATTQRRPVAEHIVWERDRPHLIVSSVPGPWTWDHDDVDFGPILRRTPSGASRRWLAAEHARLQSIARCSAETAAWRERVRAQVLTQAQVPTQDQL